MRRRSIGASGRICVVFAALSVAAVTGCEHPAAVTTDYRIEHKITAEERVFSLSLSGVDTGPGFEARDEANMRLFAREYLRRGRGPFLITRRQNDAAAFDRVAAVVVAEGVPADSVYFQVPRGAKPMPGPTRLSFSGYEVRLPQCGDWSGETGFAPTNQPHSDFGCSYQRNFGLMLSNPGDLRISREDATDDAFRTDYVVGTYRSGSRVFGRARPTLEVGDFSDVK
jgi:pilus assembly protein CpaD